MCFHCILVFLGTCEEGRASGINFRQTFPTLGKFKSVAVGIVVAMEDGGVQRSGSGVTFGSAVMFEKLQVHIFLESSDWHKHNCLPNGNCLSDVFDALLAK